MLVTEFSAETWGMPNHRKTDGSLWQFNVATGTVALGLVVATLVYRPVRMLRRRPPGPASLPWRRTIGIWAAIAVVAHVPGGLAIHSTGWQIWIPFESVIPGNTGRPFDEFTIGYWFGLFAVLALVPLLLTSNAASMRRLGARRWSRLHRVAVWLAYWLLAVHVVALQYGEFRNLRHVALTASVFAVALVARVAWRWVSWRRAGHPVSSSAEVLSAAQQSR
jgi:sulfoxide reductase heme-binding subunit YedZ